MTKRDFELVASILADLESEVSEIETRFGSDSTETESAKAVFNRAYDLFESAFSERYPRFDSGRFDKAARPIKSARLKNEILKKLGMDDS